MASKKNTRALIRLLDRVAAIPQDGVREDGKEPGLSRALKICIDTAGAVRVELPPEDNWPQIDPNRLAAATVPLRDLLDLAGSERWQLISGGGQGPDPAIDLLMDAHAALVNFLKHFPARAPDLRPFGADPFGAVGFGGFPIDEKPTAEEPSPAPSAPPATSGTMDDVADLAARLEAISAAKLARRHSLYGTLPVNLTALHADALRITKSLAVKPRLRRGRAVRDLVDTLKVLVGAFQTLLSKGTSNALLLDRRLAGLAILADDIADLGCAASVMNCGDPHEVRERASLVLPRLTELVVDLSDIQLDGPSSSIVAVFDDVATIVDSARTLKELLDKRGRLLSTQELSWYLPSLRAADRLLNAYSSTPPGGSFSLNFSRATPAVLAELHDLAQRLQRVEHVAAVNDVATPDDTLNSGASANSAAIASLADPLTEVRPRKDGVYITLDPDGRLDVGGLFDELPAATSGDREAWSRRARAVLGALRKLLLAELGEGPAFPPDHNAPPEPIPNRSNLTPEAADRFLREAEVALVELEALAPDLARLNQVIERLEALVEALTQRVAELTAQERDVVAAEVHAGPTPPVDSAVPVLPDSPRAREEFVLAEERGKWRGRFQGYAAGGVEAVAIIAGTAWRSAAALRDYVDRLRSQKSRQNDT